MKKSVIFTIALLVLVIPGLLSAQATCSPKEKAACKTACCKEMMELSEEQHAKLAELKLEQEISCIKLCAELKILKLQMKQEMSKDDPAEKELKAFVSKIAGIQEKQYLMKIEHMLAMRKILGPENWKLYKKCCGSKGGHCGSGKGCGGGGCCGMSGGCGMGGHDCMGMSGSGCGDMGGACIIKMDCSGMCGGEKTVDVQKIIKSCISDEMKGCMEGKDVGKNIEQRCIKIEKGK
jgi:hypothetical protein